MPELNELSTKIFVKGDEVMRTSKTFILGILFIVFCIGNIVIAQDDTVVAIVKGKQIARMELQPSAELIEQNRNKMNQLEFTQWLGRYQKDKLTGIIFGALLNEYAKENNISPTDEEVEVFIAKSKERRVKMQSEWEQKKNELLEKLKSPNLTEAEREKINSELKTVEKLLESREKMEQYIKKDEAKSREAERNVAKQVILSWKINKSLYDRYGGRVIFQQAGPEPVDAYRDFLKKYEKKGSFQIMDETLKDQFWDYFVSDKHTFYPTEEGTKFMNTPWWLLEKDKN